MSEMLERAAKGIAEQNEADLPQPRLRVEWDDYFPEAQERCARQARAALLAALDPEDGVLLKALTDAPTFHKLDVIDAQVIVGLIRAHAQGETT